MKTLFTYLFQTVGYETAVHQPLSSHSQATPFALTLRRGRTTITMLLLIVFSIEQMWAVAPTLDDLNFSTSGSVRIVNENFNACSTTDKTSKMAANTTLSGFGAFNIGYNNSTSNHYAIESSTFGSNGVKITMGSGSPCGIAISGKTFGSTGAWRITTTKASKMYAGIYAEGATSSAYTKANASVYIQNNAGSISISKNTSSGNWQSVGSSSNTKIDICVIYNNTAYATTYGNSITIAGKSAHVYIDGTCIMNGEYPKSFTLSGLTLSSFRIYPINTDGYVAEVDDVQIWNTLPTAAASCVTDPTIGDPTLTSITSGTINVSCPTISAGENCSISDYGFVWASGGSDPTIDNNKTQVDTDNRSTAYSGALSISVSTGVTYKIKAYATNGHSTSLSNTSLTVIPQSITFNSNEGSAVSTVYVNKGTAASEPSNPTRTGYTFGGWYQESTLENAVNWSNTISENKTYYAKWTAKTTTVTLNNQSATTAGATSVTATYDAEVPSIAENLPSKTGYTFGGYYTATGGSGTKYINADGTSAKNWDITDATKTLYAQWTVKSFTVTWMVNGEVYSAGGSSSVNFNSHVTTLPTPPTPPCGDKFMGWTTNNDVKQDKEDGLGLFTTAGDAPVVNVEGNVTYYAVFADYAE